MQIATQAAGGGLSSPLDTARLACRRDWRLGRERTNAFDFCEVKRSVLRTAFGLSTDIPKRRGRPAAGRVRAWSPWRACRGPPAPTGTRLPIGNPMSRQSHEHRGWRPSGKSAAPAIVWCRWKESNPRPSHYECAALPTELHRHEARDYSSLRAFDQCPGFRIGRGIDGVIGVRRNQCGPTLRSSADTPFQPICTPMQSRMNADSRTSTTVPVGPRRFSRRSA